MNTSIQWHDWSDATFEKAKAENKPIFLSVGYFTCFWCHVMENRVYKNPLLAKTINDHFIPIKVDRDERPDIDEIYMRARLLITKHNGWPNHVFLTPEAEPFLAAGVLLDKEGSSPLHSIASQVFTQWNENETAVRDAARQIAAVVIEEFAQGVEEGESMPDGAAADHFYDYLEQQYDHDAGGFYASPKFPHENYLLFLLSYHRQTNHQHALDMVAQSLKKMAAGSIHDMVGGGFHRYTNDREWQIPHFEKMLYSQALTGRALIELYEQTRLPYHEDIARSTLDFVLRELIAPNGAFYSAIDAETDGVEGAFYVWQEEELQNLLRSEEQEIFARCFGLADLPSQPGHPAPEGAALYARQHLMALANEKRRSYEQLRDSLAPILKRLYTLREERSKPDIDIKIISGWNGLMIDTLARAGHALEEPRYTEAAIRAAETILQELRIDGGFLARCQKEEETLGHAHLRDYAYMEAGLISLYETTHDSQWRDEAIALNEQVDQLFWDRSGGGYYVTDGTENLIVRIHRGHDEGLPAASGIMLHNLTRLYEITQDDRWLDRAKTIARVYQKRMLEVPEDYATMLQALLRLLPHCR
jgi:hypothetical protein